MPFNYRKLRENINRIYRDKPGERFCNYHLQRRIKGEPAWKRGLYIALGVVLVIGGTLLGIPPAMPGVIFVIPGLILIITRIEFAARLLDVGELKIRGIVKKIARGRG